MFESNRLCVVCNKRGHQIHHIDGNTANNKIDNLVLLCIECHDEASSKKGALIRKLSPKLIVNYREHHYNVVANERNNKLKVFNTRLGNNITTEELLSITKSAIIILELEKIKDEFYSVQDWEERRIVLNKLYKYVEHSNFRVAVSIYEFFYYISAQARSGMTGNFSETIFYLIDEFFPRSIHKKTDREKLVQVSNQSIAIAYSLIYDSFVYLTKYEVAEYGFLILKLVYIEAKKNKLKSLVDEIDKIYKLIEELLQREELAKKNKEMKMLINVFKDDLDNKDLSFPFELKRFRILSRGL